MSATIQTSANNTLLRCFVCDVVLPLRMTRADEAGQDWACTGCGSTFAAVFDENAPADVRSRALPAVVEPKLSVNSTMPASLRAAAAKARRNEYAPRGTATQALPSRTTSPCLLHTSATRQIDAAINSGAALLIAPQDAAFSESIARPGATPYDERLAIEMVEQFDQRAGQLLEMFAALERGHCEQVSDLPSLAEKSLLQAADDLDLFVALGLNSPELGYPQRHSLHAAMLAMAIATNLGFDQATLVELGLGCMIHDAGMLKLEDRGYEQHKIIPANEFQSITRHPIHTFEMLAGHLDLLPVSARMVAYQIHERCDGSGYPRGRESTSIHQLAKIAAVADVFVALVSTRPHRPALMPYHAVEQLIRGAGTGLYDRDVVRALLKTVSLFPLGSYVALNDGRSGKVLRSSGIMYDRPVVEILKRNDRSVPVDIIDLTQSPELKIVRALTAL